MEACCIGNSCLKQSGFNALVDSGTSFTFLPNGVYERIADEVYCLYNLYLNKYCISNIRVNFNSLIGELMPVDLALKAILGSIATNPGKHAGV